jgi:hypothetical protein
LHETASPREQTIIDLLRVYRDLEGIGRTGDGAGGSISDQARDKPLYMEGGDWEASGCDALDDLLRQMRSERPVQQWHLLERYVRCEVRPRRVKLERAPGGKLRLPKPGAQTDYLGGGVRLTEATSAGEQIVVVETWKPQVDLGKVRKGVTFIASNFPWDKFRWSDLTQAAAA